MSTVVTLDQYNKLITKVKKMLTHNGGSIEEGEVITTLNGLLLQKMILDCALNKKLLTFKDCLSKLLPVMPSAWQLDISGTSLFKKTKTSDVKSVTTEIDVSAFVWFNKFSTIALEAENIYDKISVLKQQVKDKHKELEQQTALAQENINAAQDLEALKIVIYSIQQHQKLLETQIAEYQQQSITSATKLLNITTEAITKNLDQENLFTDSQALDNNTEDLQAEAQQLSEEPKRSQQYCEQLLQDIDKYKIEQAKLRSEIEHKTSEIESLYIGYQSSQINTDKLIQEKIELEDQYKKNISDVKLKYKKQAQQTNNLLTSQLENLKHNYNIQTKKHEEELISQKILLHYLYF